MLGLTRELRKLGVDVRLLGPCDGPPPGPGRDLGRAESQVGEQRIGRADRGRARSSPRRTLDVHERLEPDVVHLHEPVVPGPTLSAARRPRRTDGRHVPHRPATSGASGCGPRCGTGSSSSRSASPCPSRRARRRSARYGRATTSVLWNGIEVERFAAAEPWPARRPAVLFVGRHEPRKGLERAARRVGRASTATRCCGSSAADRRPTSSSARAVAAASSGSAR